ncbi:MAG: molybdopterin-dependent oxidoreductase [Sphingomonadaceae bacterium]|nr:molybdopterin-dependent oxidoreductase [Sphingomonadaceae bacterium]
MTLVSRRTLMTGSAGLLLAGCDRINSSPSVTHTLDLAEGLAYRTQRLIVGREALAPEYGVGDLSPVFRSNGNALPRSPIWQGLAASGFRDWRLRVDGLVRRRLALSHGQLRALPRRTQITRHDCVEGWSAIGQWTGVQLSLVLALAGLARDARYIVFHCFDDFSGTPYYESIDLVDAFHPQTILAYGLNGKPLPIQNGAPLRLRVERQLGYKHAKFLDRIEAVASLKDIAGGKGGFWEDVTGYEWYAGI